MDRLKILFISHTYPPIVGGVETQNYELSTWLAKLADVKLVANRRRWLIPFFLVYAAFYAVLMARKYDVIVLGSCILGNAGWLVKKLTQKPVIAVAHGLDLTWKHILYQVLWIGKFVPSLDKLVAVGNETVRIALEKNIASEKIVFVPNGVDTEKHLTGSKRADMEKIIGQSVDNKKILLTSGRLAKRKGVAWFINNVLPKLDADFLYVIAGDGPDKQNILDAVRNNNLEKRIMMLGYITDDKRNILFNTADLFVQPNIKVPGDMEGFGISVIEAGACRLPVLASGIEGLKDAIKEGKNGFLVESGNADAFIQKINELFSQGNPRDIYGQTVRDFVVQNYSWPNIAHKYLEEIGLVISKFK